MRQASSVSWRNRAQVLLLAIVIAFGGLLFYYLSAYGTEEEVDDLACLSKTNRTGNSSSIGPRLYASWLANSRLLTCNHADCRSCAENASLSAERVFDEIANDLCELPSCFDSDNDNDNQTSTCVSCTPTRVAIGVGELTIEEFNFHTQYDCLLRLTEAIAKSGNTRVPRVAHSVYYFGQGTKLKFHQYLSIISSIKYMKPQLYFFWNDGLPQGRWWVRLLNLTRSSNASHSVFGENDEIGYNVTFYSVRRQRPKSIFGQSVLHKAHTIDITRLQALLLFGGAYLDFDAFFIKDIDPLLNSSTLIGYRQPDMLNNKVLLGEAYTDFCVLWYAKYEIDCAPKDWWNHKDLTSHRLSQNNSHLIDCEHQSLNLPNEHSFIHRLYGFNASINISGQYAVHIWMHSPSPHVQNWLANYFGDANEQVLNPNYFIGRLWRHLYLGRQLIE